MRPSARLSARLRGLWWTVHRWVGVVLLVLLVPVSLSGGLLVWHDHLDALVNPARYAITGPEARQPASVYLARAAEALPAGVSAVALRLPDHPGWPVTVMGRSAPGVGATAAFQRVYLDPPTGRVLDVLDARASLIGLLHRFHENLTIPEWSGRQIVGWMGVAMLVLSLTGLWLWWPRNGALVSALRWRRAPTTMSNLHFLVGFWIAIPLAVVSLTGVYLAFPQAARSTMASLAPMTPAGPRPGLGGEVLRQTTLDADAALAKALDSAPGAGAAAVFLPVSSRRNTSAHPDDGRAGRPPADRPPAAEWRIQLRGPGHGVVTILVDDATGRVRRAGDPLAGDRAAQWIRWIHEGSHAGPVWQLIVFLTGIGPPVLALSGVVMWWRGRRLRRAACVARARELAPDTV